jgi:hypothetical protein
MFIIPTDAKPNQTLRCVVPVDGKNLALRLGLKFNTEADYWILSVTDDVSGVMVIDSMPLIAGVFPSANLMEQYNFLQIGSCVIVKTNPDNSAVMPDAFNLGTDFKMIWGDTYERV